MKTTCLCACGCGDSAERLPNSTYAAFAAGHENQAVASAYRATKKILIDQERARVTTQNREASAEREKERLKPGPTVQPLPKNRVVWPRTDGKVTPIATVVPPAQTQSPLRGRK